MDITPIPSPESFWQIPAGAVAAGGQLPPQCRPSSGSSPGEAKGSGWASVSSSLRGCRAGTPKGMRNKEPGSPGLGCCPAGAQLGVSWGPTPPGWAPGNRGRCLPAAHSPEQGGKDTDWLSVGGAGGGGVGDWRKEGGGGGDKEGGARGTAYLEGRLQVLGEAGCPGPVLLAALDLLQQSLPGQKEGQGTPHSPGLASRPAGSQQHPGAARALWEAAFHHPTPPPAVTHHGV